MAGRVFAVLLVAACLATFVPAAQAVQSHSGPCDHSASDLDEFLNATASSNVSCVCLDNDIYVTEGIALTFSDLGDPNLEFHIYPCDNGPEEVSIGGAQLDLKLPMGAFLDGENGGFTFSRINFGPGFRLGISDVDSITHFKFIDCDDVDLSIQGEESTGYTDVLLYNTTASASFFQYQGLFIYDSHIYDEIGQDLCNLVGPDVNFQAFGSLVECRLEFPSGGKAILNQTDFYGGVEFPADLSYGEIMLVDSLLFCDYTAFLTGPMPKITITNSTVVASTLFTVVDDIEITVLPDADTFTPIHVTDSEIRLVQPYDPTPLMEGKLVSVIFTRVALDFEISVQNGERQRFIFCDFCVMDLDLVSLVITGGQGFAIELYGEVFDGEPFYSTLRLNATDYDGPPPLIYLDSYIAKVEVNMSRPDGTYPPLIIRSPPDAFGMFDSALFVRGDGGLVPECTFTPSMLPDPAGFFLPDGGDVVVTGDATFPALGVIDLHPSGTVRVLPGAELTMSMSDNGGSPSSLGFGFSSITLEPDATLVLDMAIVVDRDFVAASGSRIVVNVPWYTGDVTLIDSIPGANFSIGDISVDSTAFAWQLDYSGTVGGATVDGDIACLFGVSEDRIQFGSVQFVMDQVPVGDQAEICLAHGDVSGSPFPVGGWSVAVVAGPPVSFVSSNEDASFACYNASTSRFLRYNDDVDFYLTVDAPDRPIGGWEILDVGSNGYYTCLRCLPGTYTVPDAGLGERCEECATNHVMAPDGHSCDPCPAGQWVANPEEDRACSACPVGSTSLFSGDPYGCVCVPGYYSVNSVKNGLAPCEVCPNGTSCENFGMLIPLASAGFWFDANTSDTLTCLPALACAGDNTCAPAYDGDRCSKCLRGKSSGSYWFDDDAFYYGSGDMMMNFFTSSPVNGDGDGFGDDFGDGDTYDPGNGYDAEDYEAAARYDHFRFNGACVKCVFDGATLGVVVALAVIECLAVFCLALAASSYLASPSVTPNAYGPRTVATLGSFLLITNNLQVVSLLANIQLKWSPPPRAVMLVLSVLVTNLEAVGVECAEEAGEDPFFKFGFKLILVGFVFLLCALVAVSLATIRLVRRSALSPGAGIFEAFAVLAYYLYLPVATTLVSFFNCISVSTTDSSGGVSYVGFAPDTECWSGTHDKMAPLAIVLTVLWVVGLPVAGLVAIAVSRNKLEHRRAIQTEGSGGSADSAAVEAAEPAAGTSAGKAIEARHDGDDADGGGSARYLRWGVVLGKYRPGQAWVEAVVVVRRLLLAFALSLFGDVPGGQAMLTSVILFLTAIIMVERKAYIMRRDHFIDLGGVVGALVVLAIGTAADYDPANESKSDAIDKGLVIMGMLALFFLIFTHAGAVVVNFMRLFSGRLDTDRNGRADPDADRLADHPEDAFPGVVGVHGSPDQGVPMEAMAPSGETLARVGDPHDPAPAAVAEVVDLDDLPPPPPPLVAIAVVPEATSAALPLPLPVVEAGGGAKAEPTLIVPDAAAPVSPSSTPNASSSSSSSAISSATSNL